MDDLTTITAFLGWCTVVNLCIYIITVITVTLFRSSIKEIHSKLMGISVEKLDELYFNYLGHFKLAIIILSLSPYLALKLMGS